MGRGGKRKPQRTADALPNRRGRGWRTTATLLMFLAAVGALISTMVLDGNPRSTIHPSPPPVATQLVRYETGPRTLQELADIDPTNLADIDIARVNLLCAEGLPGADNLDIERCLEELDRWAAHVAIETNRHLYKFRQNPAEYENSEGYFRMLMLITVLQQDLGVRYNPARIRDIDFTRSEDLFIHGMIPSQGRSVQQTNGGTCVSMPAIYTAIARRLGYPLKIVTTKAHIFCRWDAPVHANPAWRDRFNVEATNQGMSSFPDDYYKTWPYQISEAEIKGNWYLQSLTPAEELAEFLATRGHCLLDTGNGREALDAYSLAVNLCPSNALLAGFQHDAMQKLNPAVAQGDLNLWRRRQRPVDPMADVERLNAINGVNMERMMRPPTLGVPQPYQSPMRGMPDQPPVP